MTAKRNSPEGLDLEQHLLIEHAQKRIREKKRLFAHFVVFLIGSVFLIIINKILKYGADYNWFVWAITFWAFLFVIHLFNVFVTHQFMGEEWERNQRERLVAKQRKRIAALEQEIERETRSNTIILEKKNNEVTEIIMIAAAGENNEMGVDNDLPWYLPDDFKRFKALTTGHKIIMGRKTFESFPKPLPNRTHIVITRNETYQPKHQCLLAHSLEDALKKVENDAIVYLIGGGEIYNLGMPIATKIELTRVHGTFVADTFFPKIDSNIWKLINEEYHPKDDRHQFSFTYQTFVRK